MGGGVGREMGKERRLGSFGGNLILESKAGEVAAAGP